jgi:hypothetical protein
MATRDKTQQGATALGRKGKVAARAAARAPHVLRRSGFRKYEDLEALPFGLTQKVIWASDKLIEADNERVPYAPTENVTIDLRKLDANTADTLVHQDDPFEIRVVGCSVVSSDTQLPFFTNPNELVVYSLDCERDAMTNDMRDSGVPRIHYHYKDQNSVKPDQYQEIPYSRSLVYQASATTKVNSVAVRFKIMELDEVDKSVRDAIQGISSLDSHLAGVAIALPYLSVLSPALKIAGEVGRKALDSYAKPDRLFTIDCGFRIAPREVPPHARPGEYLRYGYYFFLHDAVQTKLYASTTALNQILLMTRRAPGSRIRRAIDCSSCAGRNEAHSSDDDQDFVPLKGVSYLVLKVGVPVADAVGDASTPATPKLTVSMVRRLQAVVETAKEHPADKVKQDIVDIMSELSGDSKVDQAAAKYVPPEDSIVAAKYTPAEADVVAEHYASTPADDAGAA